MPKILIKPINTSGFMSIINFVKTTFVISQAPTVGLTAPVLLGVKSANQDKFIKSFSSDLLHNCHRDVSLY